MFLAAAHRGFERLAAALAFIAAALILLMSLWITYDVVARQLFGVGSPWSFDLSEYALVWITFLGAPWVLLNDRHVRIDILVDAVPTGVQRALGIGASTIAIAACAVLTWRTGTAAIDYVQGNIMMPRIWRIPRIWPYIVVPIGSGLLLLAFVARLGLYLTQADPEHALRSRAGGDQQTG